MMPETHKGNKIARAWDSTTIVYYLGRHQLSEKHGLNDIVDQVFRNNEQILVSQLALAEVAYFGNSRVTSEVEPIIVEFFGQDFIKVATFTDEIARVARSLVRNFRFKGADAVHIATAIANEVKTLETFDSGMLQRGEMIERSGIYNLEIQIPQHSGQQGIPGFS